MINGTDRLPDETEQDVIKQSFALWAAQAPLTFMQVSNQSLIPQTITIQQQDSTWYITSVQFHDAPAFCSQ
jgi:hypothetical protein